MRPSRPIDAAARAIALLLATAAPVFADPLFDADNGPIAGLFGWTNSTEGADLAAVGENRWSVRLVTSSHSVEARAAGDSILLDGETSRLWLDWRRGFSTRLELGLSLPWIWHETGGLDSFIDGWHDFFGLPQGNREAWPQDRLLFEIDAQGDRPWRLDRNSNGPGDLRIYGGWLIREGPRGRLALRAGLKLPTGDSAKMLGSGGTDLYIGVAGERSELWNVRDLSGFINMSALRPGTPDLPLTTRRMAGRLSAGLDYRWRPDVDLLVQAMVRGATFESAVSPLGDWAMSLTFGAEIRLAGDWQLAFGVGEDVKVESTPDVTLLLTISRNSR